MPTTPAEPSVTLGVLAPPYREITRLPHAPSSRLGRGSLLVVEAHSPADEGGAIPAAVAAARARYPAAPVIVRVPEVTAGTLRLAHRLSRMGVRAVVGHGEPLETVLRPVLTRPDDLADDLVKWLEFRGRALPLFLADLVRGIVGLAPRHAQLGGLLQALGHSERTVRHRFRAAGQPGPRGWHQCARALHGALRLQAEPDARVLEVALELGYSDHSGLTRQLTRAFGVTPTGIRGTLGWEWLAERWMVRTAAGASAAA